MDELNRFWNINVYYTSDQSIMAETHYLDFWNEAKTNLIFDSITFKVKKATLDIMRSPHGKENCIMKNFEEMKDMKAFQGMGVAKKVMEATKNDMWGGMFLESIKALRQSRMFIWEKENVLQAHNFQAIKEELANSCIYFSSPGSLETVYSPPQLKVHNRKNLLFSRYRYAFLSNEIDEKKQNKKIVVGICDSFHEMKLSLNMENSRIKKSEGKILRAPRQACYGAEAKGKMLSGKNIPLSPKKWEKEIQGPSSCVHLADLAREAASSVIYEQNNS